MQFFKSSMDAFEFLKNWSQEQLVSLEHFKRQSEIDLFHPSNIGSAHFDGFRVNGGRTGTLLFSFICQVEIGQ